MTSEPLPDAPDAPPADKAGAAVVLKGEVEIYPDRPLQGLAPSPLQVYAAKSRKGAQGYAILCDKYIIPRLEHLQKYANLNHLGVPRLLNMGVVYWPRDNAERFVMVYEQHAARPMVDSEKSVALGWSADAVRGLVLRHFLPILRDIHMADIAHGHLRLTNLFVNTPPGEVVQPTSIDQIVIGDCLCLPHGYAQPALYEPIERVLADPIGRGEAGVENDLYALGVCLALMVRTEDPNPDVSAREIFLRKVTHGSFATLLGKSRVTGTLLELLRGLLQDDPKQRWTLDDVAIWADGRRVTPKANTGSKSKSARPLEFAGQSILRPIHLAMAMADNVIEAAKLIESNDLHGWIIRSLEDKALSKRVEEAIVAAREHGTGTHYQDRLVASVVMLLAPTLPIMYKGLAFFPDALGRMLAYHYGRASALNHFADIIRFRLIENWIAHAGQIHFDTMLLDQRLTACRNSLKQATIGYGLERCVYTLVPDAPCLSEKFMQYYMLAPDDMILALEDMLERRQKADNPLDRHVVAFLSLRDAATIDPHLYDLNSAERHRQLEAMLQILRKLQARHKGRNFPKVSAWLGEAMQPLIDRLHDRETRKVVRQKLDKVRAEGDIAALAALLDDPQHKKRDMGEFIAAMHEYKALAQEYTRLEHNLKHNPRFGVDTGREVASMVSAFLAFAIILIVLFATFTGAGR